MASVLRNENQAVNWIICEEQKARLIQDIKTTNDMLSKLANRIVVPSSKRTIECLLGFDLTVNNNPLNNQRVYLEMNLDGCTLDLHTPRIEQLAKYTIANYNEVMVYRLCSLMPIGQDEIPYPEVAV